MKPPDKIDVNMLAPCGLNCLLCYRHLDKKPCPGCRARLSEPDEYQRKCIMRACVSGRGLFSCADCADRPCKRMKTFGKRYREGYGVDLAADAAAIARGRRGGASARADKNAHLQRLRASDQFARRHLQRLRSAASNRKREDTRVSWFEAYPEIAGTDAGTDRTIYRKPAVERTLRMDGICVCGRAKGGIQHLQRGSRLERQVQEKRAFALHALSRRGAVHRARDHRRKGSAGGGTAVACLFGIHPRALCAHTDVQRCALVDDPRDGYAGTGGRENAHPPAGRAEGVISIIYASLFLFFCCRRVHLRVSFAFFCYTGRKKEIGVRLA